MKTASLKLQCPKWTYNFKSANVAHNKPSKNANNSNQKREYLFKHTIINFNLYVQSLQTSWNGSLTNQNIEEINIAGKCLLGRRNYIRKTKILKQP